MCVRHKLSPPRSTCRNGQHCKYNRIDGKEETAVRELRGGLPSIPEALVYSPERKEEGEIPQLQLETGDYVLNSGLIH